MNVQPINVTLRNEQITKYRVDDFFHNLLPLINEYDHTLSHGVCLLLYRCQCAFIDADHSLDR